jgi:LEA14-like dessication related protein
MRRLPALVSCALLLSGCASMQRLAAAAFAAPSLHLDRATVASLDIDGASAALDFTLDNPNDVAFRVAGATWRLEVEEVQVTEGELPGGVSLPARGTAAFTVAVRLRWAEVEWLAGLARRQARVDYRIHGLIAIETPAGLIEVPYQHRGELPVPRPPELRLAGASVDMTSLTDLELDLSIDAENLNGFELPGAILRFELLLNGVPVATGREATLEPLDAGGEVRLTVPIRVSLIGAGRALSSFHGGGELRLRGTVRAGGLESPVDLKLEVGRR